MALLFSGLNGRAVGVAAHHHTKRHEAEAELPAIFVLTDAQRQGRWPAVRCESWLGRSAVNGGPLSR